MDTPDRSPGALTPWSPAPTALTPHAMTPGLGWTDTPHPDQAQPPKAAVNMRVILHAMRRNWWQILAIWFATSMGLIYIAFTKVNPSFDATAWIEVEPAARSLIAQAGQSGADSFQPYIETQVMLITSPEVLTEAISKPEIAKLPRIRSSIDPEIDLRREMAVAPMKNTHLIKVGMSGESSREVTKIVNAVVKAYLVKAKDWTDLEVRSQIEALETMKRQYEGEVHALRKELEVRLKQTGEAEAVRNGKDGREDEGRGSLSITMEELKQKKMKKVDIQVEIVKIEARIKTLQEEIRSRAPNGPAGPAGNSPEAIREGIESEFMSMPAVIALTNEMKLEQSKIDKLKKTVRNSGDPSIKLARGKLDDAQASYQELWDKLYPSLERKYNTQSPQTADTLLVAHEAELRSMKQQLADAKITEKFLDEQIATSNIEAKDKNNQMVDVRFLEDELDYKDSLLKTVGRNVEQLKYEAQNGTRIKLIAEAKQTIMPSSNHRLKIVALAPILMFVLTVGLFVLLEVRSGRVADPEEISTRLRLGVIGVVPPLPSLQPSRALGFRGRNEEKRRVEEFVQSLDHLRVTLCAPRPGKSHRRCVLITSACGGEGKTTLAAQLAGRCANAGLMTLLIDADLRRPSLGELLEVPEGPGFVDVLNGEAAPETAMVVIGNAGGFHLLPAGTMGQDPSRLLHSDRLGLLIGQFRETFDMVIIDAPPVLAVPDALLLGRWTDGAVLAVRHDTSRFPLVERANRRLASVGVPVLGAVVNGVRTMESNYGSYRYTPYAAAGAPADTDAPSLE